MKLQVNVSTFQGNTFWSARHASNISILEKNDIHRHMAHCADVCAFLWPDLCMHPCVQHPSDVDLTPFFEQLHTLCLVYTLMIGCF